MVAEASMAHVMANCCGDDLCETDQPPARRWKLALWLALLVNAGMFALGGVAG